MHDHQKGYPALRRGRWSVPEAEYFLTICLKRPSVALAEPGVVHQSIAELVRLESERVLSVRCAVHMPDHLHLLIVLGTAHTLSSAIRLFKGRLTSVLRNHGVHWQRAFYDHRLTRNEDPLPVFLYIFLNPYRAGLVAPGETWPGYYCSREDWAWFRHLTNAGRPEPQWLK